MKPELLWTPQAREDLFDVYLTIGFDNPEAAERIHTALEQRVDQLHHSPRLGVRRPVIAPSARVLIEGVYLILYETHPDTDEGLIEAVEIVRIIHGHRDLSRLF